MKKILPASLIFILSLALSARSIAQEGIKNHSITIQKVELKSTSGEWMSIIEPDRVVDLSKEEAMVSFYNNGRVPEAEYNNFRITITKPNGQNLQIFGIQDFTGLSVKKTSFISVSFDIQLVSEYQEEIKSVEINVDERTEELFADQLCVQKQSV